MNETKTIEAARHTPGPWTIGGEDWLVSQRHGCGCRYVPIRGDSYDVATVWCDEDDGEQAANVAVIAAAPEMLALLRQIVAAQETFFDRNENGTRDEFQQAADAFHASIDRAAKFLQRFDK